MINPISTESGFSNLPYAFIRSELPIVPSAPPDRDAVNGELIAVNVRPAAAVPQFVPPG